MKDKWLAYLILALILMASILSVGLHTVGMAADAVGAHACATAVAGASGIVHYASPFGCMGEQIGPWVPTPAPEP